MIVVLWFINIASAVASRAMDTISLGSDDDDNSSTFDVFE